MAQIDLKNATIKLKDGYGLVGAVNNLSGYPAGALTIAVDGLIVALVAGDTFKVAAETGQPTHTVTSVVNTSGVTTSITFTTAIATGGIADNAVITVTKLGAVNNVAGYTAALTMAVDGITGVIPTGATFLITGESGTPTHTVTSHSETSGNTTSITFTTAATAANDDVITFSHNGGAVNQPNGYTAATTMVVDGFTGAVAVGDRFTVAGETGLPVHTISAHSETSTNTTSITFSPSATVADNAVITVLPHELEVDIGEGKLEYTEKVNREYKKNKGSLQYVRNGDEEPVEVSFDFVWEFLTASTGGTPTIEDVLKQRGEAADWVSTDTDLCQPFCVDLVVEYVPPCGGEETETITLEMFRHEELQHNFTDAQISVTGKCNVTEATVERS